MATAYVPYDDEHYGDNVRKYLKFCLLVTINSLIIRFYGRSAFELIFCSKEVIKLRSECRFRDDNIGTNKTVDHA